MIQRCLRLLSASLIVSASIPALSQVVPSVGSQQTSLPLRVGAGYSVYGSDWHEYNLTGGHLGGPTVWVDLDIPKVSPSWSGFQIELQARDLNYDRTGDDPKLRQYTFGGGINYAWRYDPAFHPYVKFLSGIGNVDFSGHDGYFKDSRTFYAPGGGVDVRARGRLWIRGDYEYQFWPDFFAHHTLSPHGFTAGVFYDFSKFALSKYQP